MLVLTRTKEQCIETRTSGLGLKFYDFPCIEYLEASDGYKALDQAIRSNHLYEWVFFLSQKSVEVFFDRLLAIGGNFFNLSNHLKFAVIGTKTKEFLESQVNMPVDFMPSKADSITMVEEFCEKYKMDFDAALKIMIPRSELAKDDLKERLEASKNYEAHIVPAYNTVAPNLDEAKLKEFSDNFDKFTGVIFTSKSCVENFYKLTEAKDISSLKIYSIGEKTTEKIKLLYPGAGDLIQAKEASLEGLLLEAGATQKS